MLLFLLLFYYSLFYYWGYLDHALLECSPPEIERQTTKYFIYTFKILVIHFQKLSASFMANGKYYVLYVMF